MGILESQDIVELTTIHEQNMILQIEKNWDTAYQENMENKSVVLLFFLVIIMCVKIIAGWVGNRYILLAVTN